MFRGCHSGFCFQPVPALPPAARALLDWTVQPAQGTPTDATQSTDKLFPECFKIVITVQNKLLFQTLRLDAFITHQQQSGTC